VCVFVCVCVRKGEREEKRERGEKKENVEQLLKIIEVISQRKISILLDAADFSCFATD